MAIAFDAATAANRIDTVSTWSWSHTPVGTPKGVVVVFTHDTSTTDHVSAVDYGGTALSRTTRATKSVAEVGSAEAWFVGSSVPSSTVTVSVTCGATDDNFHGASVTFTADADTEVISSIKLDDFPFDANSHISSLMSYAGKTALSVGNLFSPNNTLAQFAANPNCSSISAHDYGSQTAHVIRQTTPGSSDFIIGGNSTSSTGGAWVAVTVSEVAAGAASATSFVDIYDSLAFEGVW